MAKWSRVAVAGCLASSLLVIVGTPAAAVDPSLGPWSGTISITTVEKIRFGDDIFFDRHGAGTYTNLTPSTEHDPSPGAVNGYRATVDVSQSEDIYSRWCGDSVSLGSSMNWSFAGQSTSNTDPASNWMSFGTDGAVVQLKDTVDGSQTFLAPHYVVFSGLEVHRPCGPSPPSPSGLQSNDALSFHAGQSGWSAFPLLDTDPTPERLVGSTTWTTGNYPTGEAPYDYSNYEYTITYDLTRSSGAVVDPECRDGLDNDGDGRTDANGGDPGCTSSEDISEVGVTQCDNALDDDGDGRIDYRANGTGDPSCDTPADDSEPDGAPCAPTYTAYPAYEAAAAGSPKPVPYLQYELDLTWCAVPGGPPKVADVRATGLTLQSPFDAAAGAALIEAVNLVIPVRFRDRWGKSTYSVGATHVTATASWKQCTSLQMPGVSQLKKAAKAMRAFGKLLRRTDGLPPAVTKSLDHVIRSAARQLEKAADGAIQKFAARLAFGAVGQAIDRLPKKIQRKMTVAIYKVLFDWRFTRPWAKEFLRDFIPDMTLGKLWDGKEWCRTAWKPQIEVALTPGDQAKFTDRSSNPKIWAVTRVR